MPCVADADCQDLVYVYHEGIVPSTGSHNSASPFIPTTYEVQAIGDGFDIDMEWNYSEPLALTTSKHGDTVKDLLGDPLSPPDGIVQITDVLAVLAKFANTAGAYPSVRTDVMGRPDSPRVVDHRIEISRGKDLGHSQAERSTPPSMIAAGNGRARPAVSLVEAVRTGRAPYPGSPYAMASSRTAAAPAPRRGLDPTVADRARHSA